MPNPTTIDIEALGLANLGGPKLAEQVSEALDAITGAFEQPSKYGKSDRIKASLTLKVDLVLNAESGSVMVTSAVRHQLPGRRSSTQAAMLRQGGLYVEPADRDDLQMDLVVHRGGEPRPRVATTTTDQE